MSVKHLAFLSLCVPGMVYAEPLTLPLEKRPEWLQRDGIVMAWSMEPLLFRVRRDGAPDYTPTARQRAAYLSEYTPEMIARLKELGVNFVMPHCYKGGGVVAERQSMQEAAEYSKRLHDAGLYVAVYNYSGAFIWELLFKERPDAADWVVLDPNGKPRQYGSATYRYYWNRNHPDAVQYYRKIVKFAVEEIKTDLIHFDNYHSGPGRDAASVRQFRQYLRKTFTPRQLEQAGIGDVDAVQPAMTGPPDNLLRRAWLDFCCQWLADSYHDMSRYARSLRPDILMECNPGGVHSRISPPVDHGRLLQGGEAFWDESRSIGCREGRLSTRIRTYKVARRMDNIAFCYVRNPLEIAESMAFNLDCLGAFCEFEWGEVHTGPVIGEPITDDVMPFVRFFRKRRELLRETDVVADVAVLRSFPSQVFAPPGCASLTYRAEKALIENRACFQIIFDHHLADLDRYRALVLAGCVALSDKQIGQIRRYVESGGRVCVIGPVATHDEWMFPRKTAALDDLPASNVVRIPETGDVLEAIRRACKDRLSLSITARLERPEARPRLTVGRELYTDRPYKLVDAPKELLGLDTIRFSHNRARNDSSLRLHAKVPVRIFAAFTPEEKPQLWLKRPAEWKLYKPAALKTTMGTFGTVMDVHYLDVPAGDVRLFEGKRGNYVLLGVKPQSPEFKGQPFTLKTRPAAAPLGLCAELIRQPDRRLVHLVNYRSDGPIEKVAVRVRVPAGRRVKAVTLASPEHEDDLVVPFDQQDDVVTFTVPKVGVYEIAVVAM